MRLLLDENLPKRLKQDLTEHEVYTVSEKGWTGVSNGQLLELLVKHQFDALLTFDKNLQYQQNLARYTIAILILNTNDNSYATLKALVPKIKRALEGNLKPGPHEVKG